ncbi:DEAD/DEAH box helicase [Chitinimonas sp. BJB300]|uniref:DEAD/DEAH box helicase n=1 Tax=Chitinimonas sp. BJB300 TaxID=1559339 RepID=UPI0027E4904A|nr:DEAD/DEAH box helicase [Chitinimonas sp. BJB300]
MQQWLAAPHPSPRQVSVLILVPTRELASQVSRTLDQLARTLPGNVKILPLFGGVSINPQMMDLRGGADIVVATPGRLLDLCTRNALQLFSVKTLVLDEADRLLDLGFAEEISRIITLLPNPRQTLLFSATFPTEVQSLAEQQLREPQRIMLAATDSDRPAIVQRAIHVDETQRGDLLLTLIRDEGWTQVLVFVATHRMADQLAKLLNQANIPAAPFHGELSQGRRSQALAAFKEGSLQVLLATDVAARGIDIVQLPTVINYNLPRSAVDYQHRIGRTGRAGASGLAISFVTPISEAHFRLIEKRQQQRLVREQIAGFEVQPAAILTTNTGAGGIKGKRKSKKDKLREAGKSD